MSADVIQLRDYQNPKDLERMRQALEQQAIQTANAAFPMILGEPGPEYIPFNGAGIDGMDLGKEPA